MRRPATVVILCPKAWGIRNFVLSGLLQRLSSSGVGVTLFVDPSFEDDLRKDDAVQLIAEVRPLEAGKRRNIRGKGAAAALMRASFHRRHDSTSYDIFRTWRRRNQGAKGWILHNLADVAAVVGKTQPLYSAQVKLHFALERRTWDVRAAAQCLADRDPDLLVSTSAVSSQEYPFLFAAQDLGIPVLSCMQSFDNITSRSVLPIVDTYAVWNDTMKRQIIRFYPEVDPQRVFVTGSPQFDFHRRDEFVWSREETLRDLGLAEDDRYILYAANNQKHTPTEPALVQAFADECARIAELERLYIVVRLHPLDNFDRWSHLTNSGSRIIVSYPGSTSKSYGSTEGQARLVSSLSHADVCINMASTMSLDAAAVNTPVVCVAFAADSASKEDNYCKSVYDTEHYRPLVKSEGVRLAYDISALVRETREYVLDPNRDAELRRRLAENFCGMLDGRSTERVAALITELATGKTTHAPDDSASIAAMGV